MISLADVLRETGWDRSALNRFLAGNDGKDVRAWLGGANTHPLYPPESLPKFKWMLRQHQLGIGPKPFAVSVRNSEPESELQTANMDGTDADYSDALAHHGAVPGAPISVLPRPETEFGIRMPDNDQVKAVAVVIAAAFVEQLQSAKLLPGVEDRLIQREEAAQLLACAPRSVSRYVRPVRPGVWRVSDIQKYIRGL